MSGPVPAAIGVDLGGTKAAAAILSGDGTLVGRRSVTTGTSFTPGMLIDLVRSVRDEAPAILVGSIGIGFPGLVEVNAGRVMSSVILPSWTGVELRAIVEQRLGLPCAVANDVHNAARAELHVRAPRGQDFFFVAVGTGIGGAWVMGGSVRTGVSGLAGEIGHTVVSDGPRCSCGRTGCVGMLASGRAIEARLGLAPGGLADRMRHPGPQDQAVLREAGRCLGRAIANLIHLVHPPLVVVGGGVSEIDAYFESAISTVETEVMAPFVPRPRIERAMAGYDAGVLGSALLGSSTFRGSAASKGPS